jgi:chromosome segregation protein
VHPDDAPKELFAPKMKSHVEGLIPLRTTIRVLNGFGGRWRRCCLSCGWLSCAGFGDGATAGDEYPHGYFLAPSGEWFHNATVSGGKPAAEGPLAVKRELREAQKKLEAWSRAGQGGDQCRGCGEAIEELAARLEC